MMENNITKIIEIEKKLSEYMGEDRIVLSGDMIELIANDSKKEINFKTGFAHLDNILGGCEGGELITISGITGNGKTLFCQTITKNLSQQGIFPLWFSYEVMPKQFLRQFGEELPNFCLPAKLKGNSLSWLNQRIYEAKIKYNIKAVFLDHLHFLIDMSAIKHNMSLEIGGIVRGLKKIALEYNIVFFLVAHTNKVRAEAELDLDHLRDSSFIAQESDSVIFIWRKGEETEAWMKVAKNRKTGIINKKIKMYKMQDGYLWEAEQ